MIKKEGNLFVRDTVAKMEIFVTIKYIVLQSKETYCLYQTIYFGI